MRLILLLASIALAFAQERAFMEEYNRAWELAGQGRADDAIRGLKAIIGKDKSFYRAYRCLVEAYADKKEPGAAERYFRSLVEQDASNGLAHYGLGVLYDEKRQPGAAAEEYAACVRRTPGAHACYLPLAKALADSRASAVSLEDLWTRIPRSNGGAARLAAAKILLARHRRMEALAEANRGLGLAIAQGDLEIEAEAHNLLGEIYRQGSFDWTQAVAHSKAALHILERLGDRAAQFSVVRILAGAVKESGDLAAASDYFEQYLDLARSIGHRRWEADYTAELGYLYAAWGDRAKAAEILWHAYRLWVELDRHALTPLLLEMADNYARQGDLAEALRCAKRALNAADAPRAGQMAFALRVIGMYEEQLGDYFAALRHAAESVQIFRELGWGWQAGAGLANVASIHLALGDRDGAARCLREALRSARKNQDAGQEQQNLVALGALELREGSPAAIQTLESAKALSAQVSNRSFAAELELRLGDACKRQGLLSRATEHFQNALEVARSLQLRPLEADVLVEAGDCSIRMHDFSRAEQYLRGALNLAETMGLVDAIVASHRGLGELLLVQREYAAALDEFRAAIDTLEGIRGKLPAAGYRATLMQDHAALYDNAIYALSRLHARQPAKGHDREAFLYAERGRARALLDMLAESNAHITKGLSAEQVRRQGLLVALQSEALDSLRKTGSRESFEAFRKAERQMADWVEELRRTNPSYQRLRYPEPYTVERTQAVLPDRETVLLRYTLGERRSHVWAITKREARMAVLPARSVIERHVRVLRETISRSPRAASSDEYAVEARRLYRLLIASLSRYLSADKRLILVPDGILYYLPFECLISTAEGEQPRYLIEDNDVAYVPSASVLGELERSPASKMQAWKRQLLAYGDPVFSSRRADPAPVADLVRSVYGTAGLRFPRLPNTAGEVRAIGEFYKPAERKLLLGRAATEILVKSERLADYRYIHFATHALLDEQAPSRSGIVLSLVNTGAEDGVLRMSEIFNLQLNAGLVVLSACRSGLGKIVKGEGMVGMTRAFLYAGAARVVVSLWEVNDLAAPDFMKAFYGQMNQGAGPAAALRAAKLVMIHSAVPGYQHPYFWAPFVLTGTM